jgi:hypothetical protein
MPTRYIVSLIVVGFCVAAGMADDKESKKSSSAGENKPEKVAKRKADEVVQATVKGDFEKIADYTYPKVIADMGGREKMIGAMKFGQRDMQARGITFHSAKVGDPSPLVAGDAELFTIVPFTLEIKVPGGRLTTKSYLLGISADKGKTWTFVDGSGLGNDAKAKQLFPNMPEQLKLKLPKKDKPIFHKDE